MLDASLDETPPVVASSVESDHALDPQLAEYGNVVLRS